MKTFGYARVSGMDRNEDRQVLALTQAGVAISAIYLDKRSGKDFEWPQYRKMLSKMRKGDLLFVLSIDRLDRNYEEIQGQWRVLTRKIGADVCVLDMPLLDTRRSKDLLGTFVADLVLQVLSLAAHHERDHIRRRQAQGIAAAKARGVYFGRPAKAPPAGFPDVVKAWANKEIQLETAFKRCGMSKSTFCRRRKEMRL